MVSKNNLSIVINILLFCTVVLSIATTTSCIPSPPPNMICLEIDQDLCENADFSTAILSIKRTAKVDERVNQFGLPYTGGTDEIPMFKFNQDLKCEDNLLVSATDKTLITWKNRYVEGKSIKWWLWEKDPYHRYSFAELFEWKFGRPPNPVEEQAISEEMAKQWFIERHTVKRPWPFADDPPYGVKVISPPIKQFCFDINQNPPGINLNYQTFTGEYKIEGKVEFGNDIKCELVPLVIKRVNYDQGNSPHRVKIKIRPVCEACN